MAEYASRQIKLETLKRIIQECDKNSLPALKEQLIIFCSQSWGIRRQSAMELLRELEFGEIIYIDGNNIWMWNRWEKIQEARSKDYLKMEDILNGYRNKTLS